MREILTILLLAALLTVALKVALAFLILAGLIFRTNETVGLIVILPLCLSLGPSCRNNNKPPRNSRHLI